jgi:hypothetical protein
MASDFVAKLLEGVPHTKGIEDKTREWLKLLSVRLFVEMEPWGSGHPHLGAWFGRRLFDASTKFGYEHNVGSKFMEQANKSLRKAMEERQRGLTDDDFVVVTEMLKAQVASGARIVARKKNPYDQTELDVAVGVWPVTCNSRVSRLKVKVPMRDLSRHAAWNTRGEHASMKQNPGTVSYLDYTQSPERLAVTPPCGNPAW